MMIATLMKHCYEELAGYIYIYIYIFHMKNYVTNYEGNVKKMDTLSTSSLQCQHIPGL